MSGWIPLSHSHSNKGCPTRPTYRFSPLGLVEPSYTIDDLTCDVIDRQFVGSGHCSLPGSRHVHMICSSSKWRPLNSLEVWSPIPWSCFYKHWCHIIYTQYTGDWKLSGLHWSFRYQQELRLAIQSQSFWLFLIGSSKLSHKWLIKPNVNIWYNCNV